ncbi:hypothetical protein Tco_1202823 [Tanacetum coccineum]
MINHGGTFTSPLMIRYKGGKVNWVDDIDSDIFSIVEVTSMMKELGYENSCMAYYYKKPNTYLDNGLTELDVDKDVYEMLMYVDKFKVIELYTVHSVNKKHVFIQEPLVLGTTSEPNEPDIGSGSEAEVDVSEDEWLQEALKKLPIKSKKGRQPSRKEVGSENGSDSSSGSDSEDSDYFVDEENLLDDVDVDMTKFKSHTNPDVEWVGCKETVVEENEVFDLEEVDHEDFDSRSDSDEDVRIKALRKVARMNKANLVKIPLSALKEQLQKKFEVGVSKQKVFRAKKMAYERVVGDYTQQYVQLRDYCMELKERNPNTTVKIEVEPPEVPDSEERKFKRIYICLGPLKDGFRAGGRDFLGLDIESESKDSWKWFLDCLGDDLGLFRNSNFTFISNRQKGVIPAIAETFPSVEHRARQLVDGRDKPIITCLEYIREYLMKRIVNVHKVQDKCDGPLTPNAAKIFKLIEKATAKLKVDWNGSELYQVTCPWVAAIWDMASNGTDTGIPESYCDPYVPTTIIPPKSHPQIGRPPKKRKKSAAELADEIMRGCKSQKSGHAGAGSQGGGDAGVGGSQTTQRTQSSVRRAQHPSFLHASLTKMTKSSAKRGGP